jgi:hypothetical protein
MNRLLLCFVILPVVGSAAFSEEFVPTRGWLQRHPSGVTAELWSDEDTWQSDPDLAEYGHSYRKLRVKKSDGSLLLEEVLPVDRALDFAYRLSVDTGAAPYFIVMGAYQFYLLNLSDPATPELVGPLQPISWDEILGVDAISGQIFDLWLSEDWTKLGGAVVNGGCFVLDVSKPSSPERVYYREYVNLPGYPSPAPCRPEEREPIPK